MLHVQGPKDNSLGRPLAMERGDGRMISSELAVSLQEGLRISIRAAFSVIR